MIQSARAGPPSGERRPETWTVVVTAFSLRETASSTGLAASTTRRSQGSKPSCAMLTSQEPAARSSNRKRPWESVVACREMFGEERLKDLLVKHAHLDAQEIITRVMEAVEQWTGGGELQDDMTMLVARKL